MITTVAKNSNNNNNNDMGNNISGDEDDEEEEEEGANFIINRGGFPLTEIYYEKMWQFIRNRHPDGYKIEQSIRGNQSLTKNQPVIPHPPVYLCDNKSITEKMYTIQRYITQLQYNHTGMQFFDVKKYRPLVGLMDTARLMVQASLPIKCLEAAVLAMYLTNDFIGFDRFPISFKTLQGGKIFRHIVLGVHHCGNYGSMGLSRKPDLMFKPLKFESLSALIVNFIEAYNRYLHHVKKIYIGLLIPHDQHSYESICWKHLKLNAAKLSRHDLTSKLDQHSRYMRNKSDLMRYANSS